MLACLLDTVYFSCTLFYDCAAPQAAKPAGPPYPGCQPAKFPLGSIQNKARPCKQDSGRLLPCKPQVPWLSSSENRQQVRTYLWHRHSIQSIPRFSVRTDAASSRNPTSANPNLLQRRSRLRILLFSPSACVPRRRILNRTDESRTRLKTELWQLGTDAIRAASPRH